MPDFVIALPVPDESAAVFPKDGFNITGVILCHQVAACAYSERSASTLNGNLSVSKGMPFSASNSGMATLSFSMSSSNVSAPVASPGNVVALRDPDPGFRVPYCIYNDGLDHPENPPEFFYQYNPNGRSAPVALPPAEPSIRCWPNGGSRIIGNGGVSDNLRLGGQHPRSLDCPLEPRGEALTINEPGRSRQWIDRPGLDHRNRADPAPCVRC